MKTRTDTSLRSILITGASSGIGQALALSYSAPDVTLFINGRNGERLQETASLCEKRGAEVMTTLVDVANRADMETWIAQSDDHAALDLVIANAGVSRDTANVADGDAARRIFSVNCDGVVNTVMPAIARMRHRHHGQIALMSSLASFRGMPNATAYCASKAMVRVWGESLRASLSDDGIRVSVICPGFIHSRLTSFNRFSMPFAMEATDAAERIKRNLSHNKGRIAFPWPLYLGVGFLACCPDALAEWLCRHLPVKNIDL